jgi:Response regulator containing CheY-like receiver, AAA-type ATPase, and DNA-binding domains
MKFDSPRLTSEVFAKTSKFGAGSLATSSVPTTSGKSVSVNAASNIAKEDGMLSLGMDDETVLIVDDSIEIRHALSRDLGTLGYKPITAATHKQALRHLQDGENNVSTAMVDLVLGHEDGLALLEEISTRWPTMRRILMSGYVLPVTLDLVRSCGRAHVVMTKPWNNESLKKAIKCDKVTDLVK